MQHDDLEPLSKKKNAKTKLINLSHFPVDDTTKENNYRKQCNKFFFRIWDFWVCSLALSYCTWFVFFLIFIRLSSIYFHHICSIFFVVVPPPNQCVFCCIQTWLVRSLLQKFVRLDTLIFIYCISIDVLFSFSVDFLTCLLLILYFFKWRRGWGGRAFIFPKITRFLSAKLYHIYISYAISINWLCLFCISSVAICMLWFYVYLLFVFW